MELLTRPLVALYLLAVFLFGVGVAALTPPFEGFDETAHFSSLRQIAATGTIPLYGQSFLDATVEDYQGPMPYGTLEPPFDAGLVASRFFARPDLVEMYRLSDRTGPGPAPFAPGKALNWQAQHPPLYYLLLAPVLKAAGGLSLVQQILVLRLVSWALAFGGLVLALLAAHTPGTLVRQNPAVWGFFVYPLALPMVFFEFARLGNDSLCLLLAGATAYALRKEFDTRAPRHALLAGLFLGLGLLTKAFFLPLTAGVALALLAQAVVGPRTLAAARAGAFRLACVVGPALLIGGGWYVYKLLVFGDVVGGNDSLRLAAQGGFAANWHAHGSLLGVVRGVVATCVTYVWAGTWSLARLPSGMFVPVLLLAGGLLAAYGRGVRLATLGKPEGMGLWILAMFAAGLGLHIVQSVALNGNGNTPGWYLHILLPWVAPMLGAGAAMLVRLPNGRPLLAGLAGAAVLYHAIALWAQFALFTGCATKAATKLYAFTQPAYCLGEIPTLVERLGVIGFPLVALVGLGGGVGCALLVVGLWFGRRAEINLQA